MRKRACAFSLTSGRVVSLLIRSSSGLGIALVYSKLSDSVQLDGSRRVSVGLHCIIISGSFCPESRLSTSDFVGTNVLEPQWRCPEVHRSQMGVIDTDIVHGDVLGASCRIAYCRTH